MKGVDAIKRIDVDAPHILTLMMPREHSAATNSFACGTTGRIVRVALRGMKASACLVLLLSVISAAGCASTSYLSPRSVRENALSNSLQLVDPKGPSISDRTRNTLRRFDLEDRYADDSNLCFEHIRQRVNEHPDADLIYALSELSYVEGKKAEQNGQVSDALNHYGISLTNSYEYLFSDDLETTRNPYDPQFRAVCDLYNESLEDTLRLLCSDKKLEPGQTYTIETPSRKFIVRTEMRGKWRPDEFDRYEFVSDYEIKTLRNRHTTYGLGVPLIAVRRPTDQADSRETYYANGLSYSVTALMRCLKPQDGSREGEATTCVLEFFDPLTANQILLANHWVPLETDLTTPLAFFLDSPEFRKRNRATEGLLNPNDSQDKRGLYMLEPYDPNRIPVLMVHGLWSSPMTWMDMFNDLRSFPEIRERYQFWFYLYPSGQPFWSSATQLRNDLVAMRDAFDKTRSDKAMDEMVLVGHSMGGLVSRLQTIDSGDEFWRIVSDSPAATADQALAKIKGPDEDRHKLVSALFFRPNSSVRRVITIGTPHRGSEFANDYTRWLARKIIRLPKMAISTGNRLTSENPTLFKDTQLLTVANAIDSLAPESPIFPVMMRAKRAPGVKYHNIVGVLENPSFIAARSGRGDGVVEFASATMDDVESELVVDAHHTSIHMISKTVFEVRRILLEHLHEVDADDRVASRDPLEEAAGESSQQSSPELSVPLTIER
jgi:pimeloyl-ACP methyl ester carboxylesterase